MRRLPSILTLALFALVAGCLQPTGDGKDDSHETLVSFAMPVGLLDISEQSYSVSLRISADDFGIISRSFVIDGERVVNPVKVLVSVPSGRDRVFEVTVRDQDDELAYQGREKVDLLPGTQSVAVVLRGYSQVRGIVCAYDSDNDAQGDPLPDFESDSVDDPAIGVQADEAGAFSFDLANGGTTDIVAEGPGSRSGFVRIAGTYGGQDFDAVLVSIDADAREDLHTVQGLVGPAAAVGSEIELYGRFLSIPGDPFIAVFAGSGNQEWRSNATLDPADNTHLTVVVPNLPVSIIPYQLRIRTNSAGVSNAVDFRALAK